MSAQLFVSRSIRLIAFVEGVSYLILIGIAMPLKYFADMPIAVRYVGMAHGVLFLLFLIGLVLGVIKLKWSAWYTAWAFFLSLVPFGTFLLDWQMKKKEAAMI